MWSNPQETWDLFSFSEEILNGKLHFCAVVIAHSDKAFRLTSIDDFKCFHHLFWVYTLSISICFCSWLQTSILCSVKSEDNRVILPWLCFTLSVANIKILLNVIIKRISIQFQRRFLVAKFCNVLHIYTLMKYMKI